MPTHYWYYCDQCSYRARRYRNVRRCPVCGGNLVREGEVAQARKTDTVRPLILVTNDDGFESKWVGFLITYLLTLLYVCQTYRVNSAHSWDDSIRRVNHCKVKRDLPFLWIDTTVERSNKQVRYLLTIKTLGAKHSLKGLMK